MQEIVSNEVIVVSSDDDGPAAAAAAESEHSFGWHRFCYPPAGDYYTAPHSSSAIQSPPPSPSSSSSFYRPPSPLSTAAFQQMPALIKLKIKNFCSRKVRTHIYVFAFPSSSLPICFPPSRKKLTFVSCRDAGRVAPWKCRTLYGCKMLET